MSDMDYHPSYAARVRDLRYLGASNKDIAGLLGVSLGTLTKWQEEYPEFAMAWRVGGAEADARVAASLFKRATGYSYTKKKVRLNPEGEVMEETTEEMHVPPDVKACVFWLTNRKPDSWQERVEIPVVPDTGKQPDTINVMEAARYVAFMLAQAVHTTIDDKMRSIEHDNSQPDSSKAE